VLELLTQRSSTVVVHHDDPIRPAAFSPDGKRVVTASDDKAARIWEVLIGSQQDYFFLPIQPTYLADMR
jgi:WD40 repeat protein